MGVNPSYYSERDGGQVDVLGMDTSDFPVEWVTWEEALTFCKRLSELPEEKAAGRVYYLPTEAEWEYAARAGTPAANPFHLGPTLSSEQANIDGTQPYAGAPAGPKLGRPTKVGSYKPNAWGLYDMEGNVKEWCADWFGKNYYAESPLENPTGPVAGIERVLRGGCFATSARYARSARRAGADPGGRGANTGFRVVYRPAGNAP
jgi:formylglycine-generating enzyme required for sulfatase activity